MLRPANVDLAVYRTGTFATKLILWKNTAGTEAFPLGEWTTSVVIETSTPLVLTSGSGLTIVSNEISVQLTTVQTEAVPAGSSAHYYMKLTKAGETVFPMRGTMRFISP